MAQHSRRQMDKKNKPTRKTSIALEKLHHMVQQMEYYYKGTSEWKKFLEDAAYIEDHLMELSTDKKIDHAKLAKKFKSVFFKENRELKEENKELEEKVEELTEQVEELKHDREITES